MRDEHPVFADTIGVLTSWSDGVLSVTRRTGEDVHIAESALVAGKVVPAAPARRPLSAPPADDAELRQVAAGTWPARESEPVGDWVARASGGFTRRANSVLAPGDPGLPLGEALARVTSWYAERGLPALLQVAAGGPLDDALDGLGWTAEGRAITMTAPLPPLADSPGAERVGLTRELTDPWLSRYHRAGPLSAAARDVLTGGASVWFAAAGDGPDAIGRVAVAGRWAVFTAVEVAAGRRREGLATAVMAALAARALTEGASGALLQVETDNAPALALHTRLGFTAGAVHHYRREPATGSPESR